MDTTNKSNFGSYIFDLRFRYIFLCQSRDPNSELETVPAKSTKKFDHCTVIAPYGEKQTKRDQPE
jgi:hypothetical protein